VEYRIQLNWGQQDPGGYVWHLYLTLDGIYEPQPVCRARHPPVVAFGRPAPAAIVCQACIVELCRRALEGAL